MPISTSHRGALAILMLVAVAAGCSLGSSSPPPSVSSPTPHPLTFRTAQGWKWRSTPGFTSGVAWVVHPRLSGRPTGDDGTVFWPRLPRDGELLMVGVDTPRTPPTWPQRRFPFDVRRMAPEDRWEGQPLRRLQLRGQNGSVGSHRVWVMVVFGNRHPTAAELAAAQAELGRLRLPVTSSG